MLIGFVFFLSGLSALIFETLWFRQCGLAFGTSVWASALVLSSFMAGLAAGNGLAAAYGQRIVRPLRLYAGLELLIGFGGLCLVLVLPRLAPLVAQVLGPLAEHTLLLRLARFSLPFVLLIGPAVAMGATLPVLVKTLFGEGIDFGRLLGRLYGINTLGAVLGAVTSELVLVPSVGVIGSGCVAASLDLAAAGLALWAARGLEGRRAALAPTPTPTPTLETRREIGSSAARLLVAACLSGGLLLALEVVWFRLAVIFVAQTSSVFAWMLSVVLSGIAVGGLLASLALRLQREVHVRVAVIALLAGAATVVAYRAFPYAMVRMADLDRQDALVVLPLAATLMFPTSLLSGLVFTLLGKRLHAELGSGVRSAGLITLANTLGSALGPLIATFLLLPHLGVDKSLRLLAAGYGLVAICALSRESLRTFGRSLQHGTAALLFVWSVVAFPSGLMRNLIQWVGERGLPGESLVSVREGVIETIGLFETRYLGEPYYYRLLTDGYSMSSTMLASQRYMSLFANIPLALHAEPRDALLISFGVGVTASALAEAPDLRRIDVVDISKEILDTSFEFRRDGANPLTSPKVHTHIEDGRYFLQTTHREYDIITGEPPPPANAGVVNLYTTEYFRLLRARLREGGIASYWLPVGQLELEDAKAIAKSFCAAFDDCTLWEGSPDDWILVGSRGASGPVSETRIRRQWSGASGERLRAIGIETPELLAALFLADTTRLEEWSDDALPLVDDWPHRAPRWGALRRPIDYADITDETSARQAFARSGFLRRIWPADFLERSLGSFSHQRLVRSALMLRGRLRIGDVHRVLTETSLQTLPLWLLGSDADMQAIASGLDADGPQASGVAYERGLGALARRDYAGAVRQLDRAKEPLAPYYALYADAMAGDLEDARRRVRALPPDPGAQAFWGFMQSRFGLAPE